jgi:hypothetical protein
MKVLPKSHFFYRTERCVNHSDLYEGLHDT